jgi:hypothetical protein
MPSILLGNYVSIMLVSVVTSLTDEGRKPGWIAGNLNSDHLEQVLLPVFLLDALSLSSTLPFTSRARCSTRASSSPAPTTVSRRMLFSHQAWAF